MATVTLNEIVTQMRQALALSEPDLDTTVGTPVRKILDAVGEVISEAYVDRHLLEYQYDINTKTGPDLDEFVRLFGFTRFAPKRANGVVTFERMTAATTDILIPLGSQVSTQGSVPVVVQTTSPALIVQGETSIDVPVQAVVGGGIGNVPANSLRYRVTPFAGISSFANLMPLSGGADGESDPQLRQRFVQTVFRNMSGTEDMFLGVALNDPSVTQASVIGATKTWRETIEVISNTVTSTIQDARHVYPQSQSFGADVDGGGVFIPEIQYTFTPSNPPVVDVLDGTAIPDGVYELQFEYVPMSSRNDPLNGVTNRIDVYVTGQRPIEASEVLTFRIARVFNTTVGSSLNRDNFRRTSDAMPTAGNYFLGFSMAPVIDPAQDQTIIIDGVTYTEGTDFFLINDVTADGGSSSSLSGIELISAANGATEVIPPDESLVEVDYIFNSVPSDVEQAIREWRLVTTDVRVHQAKSVYLNLHFAVIYEPGYSEGAVRPALESALATFISTLGFNGLVQVSDLLEVVQRMDGVGAARMLTDSDHLTEFAIQRVSATGTILETYATSVSGQIRRALDVQVKGDEYPVLNQVVLVTRATNTFGAV